jgi:hypothetical protein
MIQEGVDKRLNLGVQMRTGVRVRMRVRVQVMECHWQDGRSKIGGAWLLSTPWEYISSASAGASAKLLRSPISSS